MIFYIGAAILIVQQIADAYITQLTITTGKGSEVNALTNWLMSKIGIAALWVQKLVILPVVAVFWYVGSPWSYAVFALVAFYGVILYSNYRVLIGQRGLF